MYGSVYGLSVYFVIIWEGIYGSKDLIIFFLIISYF